MRSPMPQNDTVWSPTMSPPRSTEKPMVPGLRTPVSPWRLQVATSGSATSQAEAMVSPIFSAVPEGASTLLR